MLPPDKENKSTFSFITDLKVYQSFKGLVKNPYDESMIKKYCPLTIEAMFFELIYHENIGQQLNDYQKVLEYIRTIHKSINGYFRNAFIEISIFGNYSYSTFNELDKVSFK